MWAARDVGDDACGRRAYRVVVVAHADDVRASRRARRAD